MSGHTPGPWRWVPYPSYDSEGEEAPPKFAQFIRRADVDDNDKTGKVCGTCDGCDLIKLEDARLIAAAPSLLQALEGALDHLEWRQRHFAGEHGYGVRDQRIDEARAAIRLAKDGDE